MFLLEVAQIERTARMKRKETAKNPMKMNTMIKMRMMRVKNKGKAREK